MAKSKLIKDIATNKITLEEGLQRLLIISYSLENEKLQYWIESELNGYPNISKLPVYRKRIGYEISYSGINGGFQVKNVPLPLEYIPKEFKEVLKETCVLDGIKTLEETIRTDSKVGRNLTDMASAIYQKVGVQCIDITQQYSLSSLQMIVSNVKNKLILILLDLEKDFGNLDNLDINVEDVNEAEINEINNNITKRIYFDGTSEEL